jgi:adenylate kinase family enzyme
MVTDPGHGTCTGFTVGEVRVPSAAMQRISIIGSSGAGKSTLARELSRRLSLPWLELDSIHHQADWTPIEPERFHEAVAAHVAGERWVVDGNYSSHGIAQRVWERADTIVWLDLPRALVTARVIGRSFKRVITGEELWNGNRESLVNLLHPDPHLNIIAWAWTRHAAVRERFERLARDGTWDDIRVHRLRGRAQVSHFLSTTGRPPDSDASDG